MSIKNKHRKFSMTWFIILIGVFVANATQNNSFDFDVNVTGKGTDIILIPGLSSSSKVWDETVERYSKDFRMHAIHLPGFAGKKPIAFEDNFVPMIGDQIIDYVKKNKLKNPIVMGHSLGGFLALYVSSKEPKLFSKVISVDGVPFLGSMQNPSVTPTQAKAMAAMMKNQTLGMDPAGREPMQRQIISTMVTDPKNQEIAVQWGLDSDVKTVAQAMYDLYTIDLRDDIAKIESPILVLGAWVAYKNWGATKASSQKMYDLQYAKAKDAKVVLSDKGKHFIMWDDPDFYFEQISAFLY